MSYVMFEMFCNKLVSSCEDTHIRRKEQLMGVIKGYVEVNDSDSDSIFRRTLLGYYADDDVENETMTYMREVWTERYKNKKNRVNVIP